MAALGTGVDPTPSETLNAQTAYGVNAGNVTSGFGRNIEKY
jgi:hypothetical protein